MKTNPETMIGKKDVPSKKGMLPQIDLIYHSPQIIVKWQTVKQSLCWLWHKKNCSALAASFFFLNAIFRLTVSFETIRTYFPFSPVVSDIAIPERFNSKKAYAFNTTCCSGYYWTFMFMSTLFSNTNE